MPLRCLFVDMNAYFASAEQQDRLDLRGKPVAVVPFFAETTCCIAASYEARPYGIRTGTPVHDLRRLCPTIQIIQARPEFYVVLHRRILEAVETCLPIGQVLSIDEMTCPLVGAQQVPAEARRLALAVKAAIRRDVGEQLRCSIGLAPNALLAKLASDLQKPDGLTTITSEELPQRLYGLKLDDLPGIGKRMLLRLKEAGVETIEQLCELSRPRLKAIWGSQVLADRWYRRLRGEEVAEPPTRRHQVGHSRVLPPDLRDATNARAVLVCLLHKAAHRLRSLGYWAAGLTLSIEYLREGSWQARERFPLCRDTLTLVEVFAQLWERRPSGTPFKVGVLLDHLVDGQNVTMPMFEEDRRRSALADAMDELNRRFGKHAIYFGGMHGAENEAPTRIAFTSIPDA